GTGPRNGTPSRARSQVHRHPAGDGRQLSRFKGRRTMKRLIASLIAGAALMALPATAQDDPLRIVYTTHADSGNAFWLTVKRGMDDACAVIGADCQMLFITKAGDVAGQIANIQAAIAQQPDMIITSIVDDTAFDAVIKEAVDAGIAVISSNVDDTEGALGNARAAF